MPSRGVAGSTNCVGSTTVAPLGVIQASMSGFAWRIASHPRLCLRATSESVSCGSPGSVVISPTTESPGAGIG